MCNVDEFKSSARFNYCMELSRVRGASYLRISSLWTADPEKKCRIISNKETSSSGNRPACQGNSKVCVLRLEIATMNLKEYFFYFVSVITNINRITFTFFSVPFFKVLRYFKNNVLHKMHFLITQKSIFLTSNYNTICVTDNESHEIIICEFFTIEMIIREWICKANSVELL